MEKFKVGIIGIGFVGVAHIEALRRLGNVEVVAICGRHHIKDKANQLYVEHHYTDYKEMITEEKLDFVHICTPNNTHFEMAKYALENDINVVLEKPMTMTADEAQILTDLANKKRLVNVINFQNRLYPTSIQMKHLINQGQIGDIISIHGHYLQDWLLYDTDYSWRLNKKESGNTRAVADLGTHWMDLVEYLTNLKITEVFAEFKTHYKKRKKPMGPTESFSINKPNHYEEMNIDTEDVAMIFFRFSNHSIGNLTISQMAAGNKNNLEVNILGSKSSIHWSLQDLENIKIGHRDSPNQTIAKDYLLTPQAKNMIDYPAGHMEGYPDSIKQVFKEVYQNHDSISSYYATFEDGLRQMILCEKIFESANKHQWVKI
ncbi:Gfo/Idh/MocA family oxidoreductase [Mycoplasmatota bacterium]|nr:Gfo/Idh/MocA family oxidoreductase [Mycoplasmatota bacterium]